MTQERRSVFGSAKVIAVWTLVSRVTGLVRDMRLNHVFGQNWIQDAFNYGFLIPNLFRRLFGEGALSAVFVPTFTDTLHHQNRPAAWQLLGRVLTRMVVALTVITMVIELGILIAWLWPRTGTLKASDRLVLQTTAIMLPFMISICVVALFSSILNCLGRFGGPAAMPIVLNICMLIGIDLLGPALGTDPQMRVKGVALSVLAAGVVQLLLLRPMLRQEGVKAPLAWGRRDEPGLQAIIAAFIPVTLGQGAILISTFLESYFCRTLSRRAGDPETFTILGHTIAYPLRDGALSAMSNAQRLYQFPLGVLAISLATAALPMFSLYAAQRDFKGLRDAFGRAMRLAIFEGLPCGIMLFILAEPIIRLLFQYGRYTPEHTLRAAGVLAWYGLGVWAFCIQHVILRGFYSLKDTRTPMWIGVGMVIISLSISFALIWHSDIREKAFGISTSATAALNVGVSLVFLRRRMQGRIGARALARGILRTAIATLVAAAVAWGLRSFATDWGTQLGAAVSHGRTTGLAVVAGTVTARMVGVFLPLLAAMAVYLGVAMGLRMEETGWLFGSLRRRGAGAPADATSRPRSG